MDSVLSQDAYFVNTKIHNYIFESIMPNIFITLLFLLLIFIPVYGQPMQKQLTELIKCLISDRGGN